MEYSVALGAVVSKITLMFSLWTVPNRKWPTLNEYTLAAIPLTPDLRRSFGKNHWIRGIYQASEPEEGTQVIDVVNKEQEGASEVKFVSGKHFSFKILEENGVLQPARRLLIHFLTSRSALEASETRDTIFLARKV